MARGPRPSTPSHPEATPSGVGTRLQVPNGVGVPAPDAAVTIGPQASIMISMCGRYTLRKSAREVAEAFGLAEIAPLEPRYNIAPSQSVPVVRLEPTEDSRRLDLLRWGLIPSWADDPAIGNRMINARSDTVADKPAYRHAFKAKRCLIVADGFYEWMNADGRKQPHFIHLKDDRPFALAGLWERWDKGGEPIESCTIITTDANELLAPIHDRMPVIIPQADYDLWLDPAVKDPRKLQPLLSPFDPDEMEAYPVSTLVNRPSNDVERCIERMR
jgi:putative SOS response-associated peptidase YedK